MTFSTLISPEQLAAQLGDPGLVIVDCRFSLADTQKGQRDYQKAHIPGAHYAHLDHDLSGKMVAGKTSRHPLPDIQEFSRTLGGWGVGDGVQVAAYDDSGGMIAARLWWMLHWLGHDAAAVLDGGWQAWLEDNRAVVGKIPTPLRREFNARPRPDLMVEAGFVASLPANMLLVDSRTPERFRGEQEPIDPLAGRIPGACNLPHTQTLGPDGKFLPRQELRARFEALLGETAPQNAVFYCGSGVSAARNLLALAHAGLGDGKLYAGSWSEWITDESRPVETGPS